MMPLCWIINEKWYGKKVFNSNYDLLLILTYKYTKYGFRLLILDYPVQPVSVENNRNWWRSVSGKKIITENNDIDYWATEKW